MNRQVFQQRQRLRLLYSLGDFQLALSAAAFLSECDPDEKYSKVELRRFRCYETAMIMGYTRPFSEAKGEIPRLTLKMAGVKFTDEQQSLHRKFIRLRNKVIAHSDAEMMRVVSKAHSMKFDDRSDFIFFETVFDEGLTFIGHDLIWANELLHIVSGAVYTKLIKEAQRQPADFDLRRDYLDP
ncbi:hypothetical protein [Chelativorans salis]|uniref:HEPN AbiU2-like domain-containing protein n=1 Tax=Chelativorans salis TaxID=2978478 RepID=A0ABT2LUZ5_9HYPH|nr:hypothetical protein [Chelativorans sp. EGI FJ00035]MCT7377398.1 hypothetical protein [Chelativorans sp. EGI FJ00035]